MPVSPEPGPAPAPVAPAGEEPDEGPDEGPDRLRLSVVIPAHNEAGLIHLTVQGMHGALEGAGIPHELVVVDDASVDGTGELLDALAERLPALRVVHRRPPPGVGRAVRAGLEAMQGDAAVVVMADGSDRPEDVCAYYRELERGADAVFGSRFVAGGAVEGYPRLKLLINRAGNLGIRLLFGRSENDLSNALKAYRKDVLRAVGELTSDHFEIFVELPLKTLATGARIATVPVGWHGRRAGASKLKLARQLPRYARVILRLWLARIGFAGRGAQTRPLGTARRMLSS
jgi:dolichol-phosphate mannosyltransferase